MTDSIELSKDNGVATVTLNRPEKHNAFDDSVIGQMTEAFEHIEHDDSIRLMVLASSGKSFSAGADLAWMKRMAGYSYDENLRDARALANMLKTLNNLSKPSIARVQGATFGGAVGLVSCCDIAIASSKASFCLSEVKIGLIPATISPYVVAAIGSRAARRLFITAERFNAERAFALNLVSEVCDPEQLDARLSELSEIILANSPAAVSAAKQLVLDISGASIDDDLIEDTSKRIAAIRTSKEGQEGLTAFLDKRPPSWIKPA
jgi:methylglutaconyl-CoA hydratase